MEPWVPGRGDPMSDNPPLFITFKPIGKDDTASAKLEPNRSPVRGAEQLLGHHDADGRVPPGSWPSPPGWSPLEGDLPPELVALRARTRLWFEQTQARRLRTEGELPVWFHGFISRRETERLLQDQPLGCFLVRFSESTVGFVLSYRGRDRCRHFVLDQLPDGHYVILGERSAHAELPDLLQHYSLTPVTPYHEFLTVPRRREDEPQGWTQDPAGSNTARPPPSAAPTNLPAHGTVAERPHPGAGQAAAAPPVEPSTEGATSRRAPSVPPPLPAKGSSSATAPGGAAPQGPYTQAHKGAAPLPTPPEAKYQQLLCFHTYAEPHEAGGGTQREEPIPFYAMGRGSSPNPEENIYSEVALAQQDPPAPLPRGVRGACSTLPIKSRTHRRLFRSVSSQVSKRQQLPAAPPGWGKEKRGTRLAAESPSDPMLEFDDPVYGRERRAAAAAPHQDPENIYEQLPRERR